MTTLNIIILFVSGIGVGFGATITIQTILELHRDKKKEKQLKAEKDAAEHEKLMKAVTKLLDNKEEEK